MSEKGLSLIEILISVAVLAVISTTILVIVVTTLRSSTKTLVVAEVKQNGETAVAIISDFVRRADSLVSACNGVPQDFFEVEANDGQTTRFFCDEGRIASQSALSTIYLTSEKVSCSSFVFSCSESGGYPLVEFSFLLSPTHPDYADQESNFATKVLLRQRSH